MNVLMLILIFIGICFFQFPELFKKKEWTTFVVSLLLLIVGFTLSLLQIVGVKVPNPNKSIEIMVKALPSIEVRDDQK